MRVNTIPTGPAELTPQWLTATLRESRALRTASVTRVQSEALGEGRGFTGRVVRLRLDYDTPEDGAPRSLIVKLPAADPTIRTQLMEFGLYEREIRFYAEIAASGGLPVPRMYGGHVDVDAGTSILLLEDLEQARLGDNVGGCSDEDAYLTVARLARFHAAWWEHPRLMQLEWLAPGDPDASQEACQSQLAPFLEKFGDLLTPRLHTLAPRLAATVAACERRWTAPPRTIVHRDFKLDNLIFGPPESAAPLTIIDWQLCSLGRGTADLAYFAAFCLGPEQRRSMERRMVEAYHATLLGGGVHGYDLAQCWEDYRFATLTALQMVIVAGALLDMSSERGQALMATLIGRIDAILADHNVGDLLPTGEVASRASTGDARPHHAT